MEEQKQVKLIGIRLENQGIIKIAELTPDILEKRLVTITGETGNGKSTLLDAMKAAISGSDAIKKKDILEKGYLAEAQLSDGDIKLFVGAKVTEYQRGENKGEPKFEIFLYAKDDNGKSYQPIIDGVACSSADYVKMLTTELTFSMPDLHSENQSVHRKLIEKLFKPELDALGSDEVVEKILKAKKVRDNARALVQANGAFMEAFKEEGWDKNTLEQLVQIDVKKLEDEILTKKLEKDRIENGGEDAYNLAVANIDKERSDALQKIKDEGLGIKEQIRVDNEAKEKAYQEALKHYNAVLEKKHNLVSDCLDLRNRAVEVLGDSDAFQKVQEIVNAYQEEWIKNYTPIEPKQASPDQTLAEKLQKSYDDYNKLNNTPLNYPEKGVADTRELQKEITNLEETKTAAEKTNSIYTRFQYWTSWIEAKGIYEKEIDTLRKLYASIDCGVEGMNIVPRETESGKIEVWVMYNGQYDVDYFNNKEKEHRFMFEYSSFQRTIIGLMLQAARLNKKRKALRLAFVDDVAFTTRDLTVLKNISEKLDLNLIVAWTHEVEKNTLLEGQVMVEGGEIFFNKL